MNSVTIIGAGAVGRAFAKGLSDAGMPPAGIFSRQGKRAARLAGTVGTKLFGTFDHRTPLTATVIIAVPDAEINTVVSVIVGQQRSLKRMVILHTSGGLTSDELLPLKNNGAAVGSLHPLQTFSSGAAVTRLKGIYCAVEGDAGAVKRGTALARSLGARPFVIRKSEKVLYHIAAVFASNYLVTVLSVAEQLAKQLSVQMKDFNSVFGPLILQTVENVLRTSPEEALTGPIKRGDGITVEHHVRKLGTTRTLKRILPLYAALGIETAALAKRQKR